LVDGEGIKQNELVADLAKIQIEFRYNSILQRSEMYLNGENVEEEIRQLPVSQYVSHVAAISEVRKSMVKLQQALGSEKGIVMDGRDIGTVVFPKAELKIFVTASAEIRARRRFIELSSKGESVTYTEILKNVQERDHIDSTRKTSPLIKAKDALVLDNSHMSKEEQLEWVFHKVNEKLLAIGS